MICIAQKNFSTQGLRVPRQTVTHAAAGIVDRKKARICLRILLEIQIQIAASSRVAPFHFLRIVLYHFYAFIATENVLILRKT